MTNLLFQYGDIYERVCNTDLGEMLKHFKWVSSVSSIVRCTIELDKKQQTALHSQLSKTKYHELLQLLPAEDQKKLQSNTPSIQTDGYCTIEVNSVFIDSSMYKFHLDGNVTKVLKSLTTQCNGHILLLNESTARHVSNDWWIKGNNWPTKLRSITSFLGDNTSKYGDSLKNFIFKMLQLERLVTAWRIKHSLPNEDLFPMDNIWVSFSSIKRPSSYFIDFIKEAVPTVSNFNEQSKVIFNDADSQLIALTTTI